MTGTDHDGGGAGEWPKLWPSGDRATPYQRALGMAGVPWHRALLSALGYAEWYTRPEEVAFEWGRLTDRTTTAHLADHCREVRRDVVFLDLATLNREDQPRIVMVNFDKRGVTVSEDCELWMMTRSNRVEILTAKHRFRLKDDGYLERRRNNLDHMRARRVRLAHDRWSDLAAAERAKVTPLYFQLVSLRGQPEGGDAGKSTSAGAPLG